MGWVDFRPYGQPTWAWASAALSPKFLLSSASMTEDSLCRVAGIHLSLLPAQCSSYPLLNTPPLVSPCLVLLLPMSSFSPCPNSPVLPHPLSCPFPCPLSYPVLSSSLSSLLLFPHSSSLVPSPVLPPPYHAPSLVLLPPCPMLLSIL